MVGRTGVLGGGLGLLGAGLPNAAGICGCGM